MRTAALAHQIELPGQSLIAVSSEPDLTALNLFMMALRPCLLIRDAIDPLGPLGPPRTALLPDPAMDGGGLLHGAFKAGLGWPNRWVK
jgi:hypothetical protein